MPQSVEQSLKPKTIISKMFLLCTNSNSWTKIWSSVSCSDLQNNWWTTIWCVGLFTGLCKSYYLTTINCCISWTNIFLYYHHQRISTSCNQTTDFMDEHHVGCCCKFVYRFRHVSNVRLYNSGWRRFPNIFTEGRFKGNMLSILPVNEVCGKMS